MASTEHASDRALFLALAEDLKVPLLRIAYEAEIIESGAIELMSREALQLLDGYIIGLQEIHNIHAAPAELINPTAILQDTMHEVCPYARQFACELRLYAPAVVGSARVNAVALRSLVNTVSRLFIDVLQTSSDPKKIIEVAAYPSSKGLAVGVFHTAKDQRVFEVNLAQARERAGKALRPLSSLKSGSASYLFVAEQLARAMQTQLRLVRRGSMHGLVIDLQKSEQLILMS